MNQQILNKYETTWVVNSGVIREEDVVIVLEGSVKDFTIKYLAWVCLQNANSKLQDSLLFSVTIDTFWHILFLKQSITHSMVDLTGWNWQMGLSYETFVFNSN